MSPEPFDSRVKALPAKRSEKGYGDENAPLFLIKTKFPRFYLKQGSFTLTNLMERVKTTWEPCVF